VASRNPLYDPVVDLYGSLRSDTVGLEAVGELVKGYGPDSSVLDLGCGTGRPIAMTLAPQAAQYVGVDESEAMLRAFARNVPAATALQVPMEEADFPAYEFDVVFSWGALCHLRPDAQVRTLKAAVNWLRPGGTLAFTTGPEAGEAVGRVGPLRIIHYSFGTAAYDTLLIPLGMQAIAKAYAEGGFFLYTYKKPQTKINLVNSS